jgi:cytochrome c peroxidase
VELGRQLFFDPRLSGSGQIACASCHDSQLGWGDGRDQALGHDRQRGPRNAMTLLNVGHFERLFWDGRADGLEGQALKPITNPVEMHNTLDAMLKTLNDIPAYRQEVEAIFGSENIEKHHVAQALAAFQRTIVSRTSRVDEFLKGDREALSGQELRGLHLFRTKARCMNCHDGPLLSDRQFHNTGLHYYGRKYEDLGRYEVTGDPEDAGRFRTPSLRDIAVTGPWMHNGLFPTLEGIINMYDAGGVHPEPDPDEVDDPLFPETSRLLQPLELTSAEKEALEAFLRALSEIPARVRAPETLPPSE